MNKTTSISRMTLLSAVMPLLDLAYRILPLDWRVEPTSRYFWSIVLETCVGRYEIDQDDDAPGGEWRVKSSLLDGRGTLKTELPDFASAVEYIRADLHGRIICEWSALQSAPAERPASSALRPIGSITSIEVLHVLHELERVCTDESGLVAVARLATELWPHDADGHADQLMRFLCAAADAGLVAWHGGSPDGPAPHVSVTSAGARWLDAADIIAEDLIPF